MTGVAYSNKQIELFSDSLGYDLLSKLFWFAANLQGNELIHIPVDFKANEEFKSIFKAEYAESNLGLFLINYHCIQLSPKEIKAIMEQKIFDETTVGVPLNLPDEYPYEYWDLKNKLTVKKFSKYLFLSGNRDVFMNLAETSLNLIIDNEDIKYCHLQLHYHKDMDENTYKSDGITFRFWNNS